MLRKLTLTWLVIENHTPDILIKPVFTEFQSLIANIVNQNYHILCQIVYLDGSVMLWNW